MILPRGAFHSIKKGVMLSKLLHELEISHFSGLSIGSAEGIQWALVFEEGACIMAEFGDLQGSRAWHEIISREAMKFDSALSMFTEDQIQLSIEYNKHAVVQLCKEPVTHKEREDFSLKVPRVVGQSEIATSQGTATGEEARDVPQRKSRDLPVIADMNCPEGQSSVQEDAIDEIQLETKELDSEELAHKDLDSLDSNEIETMSRRIRMNLKETMERLNLGYLMEEKQ